MATVFCFGRGVSKKMVLVLHENPWKVPVLKCLHQMTTILGDQTRCTCMVILIDFPYNGAFFLGW